MRVLGGLTPATARIQPLQLTMTVDASRLAPSAISSKPSPRDTPGLPRDVAKRLARSATRPTLCNADPSSAQRHANQRDMQAAARARAHAGHGSDAPLIDARPSIATARLAIAARHSAHDGRADASRSTTTLARCVARRRRSIAVPLSPGRLTGSASAASEEPKAMSESAACAC